MIGDFGRALPIVLRFEGGWYDGSLPGDPNPTMQGITQRTYDRYRADKDRPLRTVREIERHELMDLYERRYWEPCGGDRLEWPLCAVVFDTAVNMGVSRSRAFLAQSPHVTPYLDLRTTFYRNLVRRNPKMAVFLKGWLRRVALLRALV
jgi:lysozyme family protein